MDPNDHLNMAGMLQDLVGGGGGLPMGGLPMPPQGRGRRRGASGGPLRGGMPANDGMAGVGGGGPGSMTDLAALFSAMGPDGMPDFDKLGKMAGMDSNEMKGHAQRLWKHMDDLHASNPDGYKDFLSKQAKNAGRPSPNAEDGGASTPVAAAAAAMGGGGAAKPEDDNKATFLMPLVQAPKPESKQMGDVGLVSVWRAKSGEDVDKALLPMPGEGRPVKVRKKKAPYKDKVPFTDPRKSADEQSLLLLGAGGPGLIDATVYEVEVHAETITKALDDLRFQAQLLESVIMHIEQEYDVAMDRNSRRVYTHRGDATPTMAAAAAAQALSTAGSNMSSSLLTELAGIASSKGGGKQDGKDSGAGGASGGKPKGPLIQEVAAEASPKYSVRVERDGNGLPVDVEVTVELPSLASVAEADLQVTPRYIHFTPARGAAEMCVILPVLINEESVKAKFKKNEKRLTIRAAALAS